MKRMELLQLLQPLTDRLYGFAYALMPDDLQAEQLVVDSLNAFLIKEKKALLKREIDLENKKESQILRRSYFKILLRYMSEIGLRRSMQLADQLRQGRPEEYAPFYSLEPKVRMVMSLRYEAQFSVEEIEEITHLPRFEIIEKIHNGRFLLLNHSKGEVNL
jgi:DNA-directed RNA polymerase specialized sigma24 family protein